MKIGIITDIRNNVNALEAMLNEFKELGIGGIICCGDIIGFGPRPDETVKTMMTLDNLLVCLEEITNDIILKGCPQLYLMKNTWIGGEMEHHKWEHNLLSKESKSF